MDDDPKLALGTRIHLGQSLSSPTQESLYEKISKFIITAASFEGKCCAGIAVDPTPKITGYDLPSQVRLATSKALRDLKCEKDFIDIIPVCPWGKFVPALNALVSWACSRGATQILFVSAETELPPSCISQLCHNLESDTLVVGVSLSGHEHTSNESQQNEVPLSGSTCPWNTAAIWNIHKLALTGFPLISEGLHEEGASGVEEVPTVAILQNILPPNSAKAKLLKLPNVTLQTTWNDEKRNQWHQRKMKSKYERASRQLQLLGFTGTVVHVDLL